MSGVVKTLSLRRLASAVARRAKGLATGGLASGLLRLAGLLYRNRPVPMGVVAQARRMAVAHDGLYPRNMTVMTTGLDLRDAHLAATFAESTFGEWSLAAEVVNFLEAFVRRTEPAYVLELGSGLSTACLAHVLAELPPGVHRRLVSIDQSSNFVARTRDLVDRVDVAVPVELHVRPLQPRPLHGAVASTYDLDDAFLTQLSTPSPPDLVLVDGPTGGGAGRFAALEALCPYLRDDTVVFMDDGLRDEEIGLARRSRTDSLLRVEGVYLLGKGLVIARTGRRRAA